MISVLYVDDEPMFLDIGKRFLERSGKLVVDTFLSADIAVKIIPLAQYDAIISDYQMPGMDGIAFLSEVRLIDHDIPFIVYTGQGREEVAIQALNRGADFYLLKGGSPIIQFGEIENFILNIVAREHQKDQIISEKRKTEEALSLLQTLYEYAPFGFAFVDGNFVFIHLNDAIAEISGIPRVEHLGRSMDAASPYLWSLTEDLIKKVVETGNPVLDHRVNGEIRLKPGTIKTWLISLYPVRTKADTIFGVGILIIDNTARNAIEQALEESEERYRTLAESAEDVIFIVGQDNRLSYMNSYGSHLRSYGTENLIGVSIEDSETLIPGLIHEDGLRSVFSTGQKYSYDAEIRRGEELWWIEVLLIPMPGYNNPAGQVMGIGRDVTRRKKAESGLLNANRKLNLLSSITRHDIINQLSFLFLYLDNLKKYTDVEQEGKEAFDLIHQSVKTIHQQIEFTREYQEIGIAAPIWQNLHQVIQKATMSLPMKEIQVKEGNTDVRIFADSLFEKVIYNLMENALRYGKKITVISCMVRHNGDDVMLIIEDDGVGIPPEEKEQIFSFGFGKHTGFGLFMAREVLSITGITITETGTPGVGAQFKISIPREFFEP